MRPEVSILIVDYNAGPALAECVRSFVADTSVTTTVVVVDNASTDGSADALEGMPGVRVIRLGRNAGFGAGNNAGLPLCETPYVLMVNPDTTLRSGRLAQLVAFMDSHPSAAVVGPRVFDVDGSRWDSMGNYPSLLREAFEGLFLHRLFPRLTDRLGYLVQDPALYASSRSTDWVSGAALFARTEAVRKTGGFDEGFFLYSEEIDLCRRLSRGGWEVWYTPEVDILHVGGAFGADPALALEHQRSKLRYFRKHHGRVTMLALAALIAARLSLRSGLWAVSWLIKRDERRLRRLRSVLRVLSKYPGLVVEAASGRVPDTIRPVWAEAA